MTTADLLALLARFPGALDIDDVARRSGHARRDIEKAIQQARLEGQVVITDGGLRLARTSAEAFAVYRALRRRMATQTRTAWAVRSQAMLMERGERAARLRAIVEAQAATGATHPARRRLTAPADQTSLELA